VSSSKFADEGTIAHALAAMCLTEGKPAAAYVGRLIVSKDYEHATLSPSGAARWMRCAGSSALETRIKFKPRTFSMQVTTEMAEGVQIYLDNLMQYMRGIPIPGDSGQGMELLVEQRLPVDQITGEKDATGSGDAVILDYAAYEIQVHDLKFGKGVEVLADENEQLAMYLLGALEVFGEFGEWHTFRGVIHQPRINPVPSEYTWTFAELRAFEAIAKDRAALAILCRGKPADVLHASEIDGSPLLVPGEKQCKFCDAKASCPALAREVAKTVFDEFEALDTPESTARAAVVPVPVTADNALLAARWLKIELIEGWCAAIAAKAEQESLAGRKVPGLKVVQGKKGNRAWESPEAAEEMLKSMRIKHDQMYDYSVISPTSAEKLAPKLDKEGKAKPGQPETPIGERQWKKLQEIITQAPGKPTVVPESDKRPALVITPVIDEFESLPTPEEELV